MPSSEPPATSRAEGDPRVLSRHAVDLAYWIEGEGPAIVLIPSLGRGTEDFDRLAPALAGAGQRVLRPEPRGIGRSSPLRNGDTLHEMAADIAAVIEAERLGPAILVGHAAGNWVARVLAHDRPDLTRAVALLAAIVTGEPSRENRASISGSFDMSLPEAIRLAHLSRAYFAPDADARAWLSGWWPEVAKAQREAARATSDTSWTRVADSHPTLYLGAAEDVISPPPTLAELRNAIGPKATLAIVENAGHALLPEQPEAVLANLRGWIAELP
jgi:pimeloyl-ACP methyl ester carboxylesterase